MSRFAFQKLQSLLGLRADDRAVVELHGQDALSIERSGHLGFVEFKSSGVSVMFKEAPWVIPEAQMSDPAVLHVSAVHLHRKDHEGYSQYDGQLPGGVVFGDSKQAVVRKLGKPLSTGGGGVSLLKLPIPFWLKYVSRDTVLHFQLDGHETVEMLTLMVAKGRSLGSQLGD